MTVTYTNSKGEAVEIATMPYPHLVNAHARAVKIENLAREVRPDHRDDQRQAEIDAMAAEIERRDAAYAAQQDQADGG